MKKAIAIVLILMLAMSSLLLAGRTIQAPPPLEVELEEAVVEEGSSLEIRVTLDQAILESQDGVTLNLTIYNDTAVLYSMFTTLSETENLIRIPVGFDWNPDNYTILIEILNYTFSFEFKIISPEPMEEVDRRAVEVMLERARTLMNLYGDLGLEENLTRAVELYSDGNYAEAFRILLSLMHQLRPQLRERAAINESRDLQIAIQRHLEFIERMNEILNRLESKGFDVSEAREVLLNASMILMNASILNASTSKVARMMAFAVGHIGKAMRALKHYGTEVVREKLNETLEKLLESVDLPEEVRGKLKELRERLEEGNYTNIGELMREVNKLKKETRGSPKNIPKEKERGKPPKSSKIEPPKGPPRASPKENKKP